MAGRSGRVVVGVSGSLGSLAALRRAVTEARSRGRSLVAVLVWTPPGGEVGYRQAPCPALARAWADAAKGRLRTAFSETFGGYPPDVPVEPLVVRCDSVGRALCEIAGRPEDLLVVGAGKRGPLARLHHGHVARHVLGHARCPVLAVPWTSPFEADERALRRLHRIGSPGVV
ncbi:MULTISPECIES: universal stress protein [Streptacidiphilus]|uniref:Universal stress protein n=1 Tax=Streptacidiphilus cavernicola TaxID=3342716 RepID=A0ABV6V1C2_9ACTN|nr:universal stress protein [Streptacidiphilus jeojiense]